jgi:hypothetical protein
MGSPICSRGHGPDRSLLTNQQLHDHLARLRDQMVHLAAKAAGGYEGSLAVQDLRNRIGQAEHVLVDRLLRAEQLALARLREESRRPLVHAHPERMFETMPDDIMRCHVLPFLEPHDLVHLAQASEMGMSSAANLEIEQILQELRVLSGQHPLLASLFKNTLSAADCGPAGQTMHGLIVELANVEQAIMARTDLKPWADLYFGLKEGPQTRLQRLLTRETIKAIAYDFNFGIQSRESRALFGGNREIVLEAVSRYGSALEFTVPAFRGDREIVTAAIRFNGSALRFADPEFRQDKKIVLEAVRQYGLALRFAAPALRREPEIVLAALLNDWRALGLADAELRKDKQIVLTAVRRSGRSLFYANDELKRDKEIVLAAVSEDGSVLQFADLELRKDREVVLATVRNHGRTLFWADPELQRDREIVLTAVRQDVRAFAFAHPELQQDPEIKRACGWHNQS